MSRQLRATTGVLAAAALVAGTMAVVGTSTAHAAPTCNGKPVTKVIDEDESDAEHEGTEGDDVVLLKGSAIYAYFANGGDDTVCVEAYSVEVTGDAGDDWISAELTETTAAIDGGPGDDTIIGSNIDEDDGWDELYGGPGSDKIDGLEGDDVIFADRSMWSDDVTDDAADEIRGGDGDDLVTASTMPADKTAGSDRLIGGAGSDTLSIDGRKTTLNVPDETVRASSGGPVDTFTGFGSFTTSASADIEGTEDRDRFTVLGPDSTLEAKGGNDRIDIGGKNATIRAGDGADEVAFYAPGKKNQVRLGDGDDRIQFAGSLGVTVKAGKGDDRFDLRTHGDLGEGPGEYDHLFPMRATLLGKSGIDTLTWDCKSKVDAGDGTLDCSHKSGKINFGGMQVYKAGRAEPWKDVFHGSSRRDVFYGGGKNDEMYGHRGNDRLVGGKGDDIAFGGKGRDSCTAEREHGC